MMKRTTVAGMTLCSLLLLAPSVFALPLDENVEAKTLEKGWWSSANEGAKAWEMLIDISDVYLTPICQEWPYVDENGRSLDYPKGSRLDVQQGTRLSEALDGVVERSAGMLRWERNHGSICVVGTDKGAKGKSCLDTRIDLHVEKISAWDALCAVARAANERPVNGRRMGIYPGFIQMRRLRTPEGLKDTPCITLDLKDVPARDAVCAIIAQAPFKMAYTYFNKRGMSDAPPAAKLTMYIYEDNGRRYHSGERMTDEEYFSYLADYYEMVGDEKEATKNRLCAEYCRKEEAQQKAQEEAQKEEAQEEAE